MTDAATSLSAVFHWFCFGHGWAGGQVVADGGGGAGKKRRSEPSSKPRRLKSNFTPESIEAFYFADPDAWASAMASGAILHHNQGQQPPAHSAGRGKARNPKYAMNIPAARKTWQVGEVRFS